jgi:hypothetical protein
MNEVHELGETATTDVRECFGRCHVASARGRPGRPRELQFYTM